MMAHDFGGGRPGGPKFDRRLRNVEARARRASVALAAQQAQEAQEAQARDDLYHARRRDLRADPLDFSGAVPADVLAERQVPFQAAAVSEASPTTRGGLFGGLFAWRWSRGRG